MTKYLTLLIFITLLNLPLTACVIHQAAFGDCAHRLQTADCHQTLAPDADLIKSSFTAADNLMQHALMDLYPGHRVLMTTIANIDNLTSSSSLGRLISEQLSARFAQKGYTVQEARLYDYLIVQPYSGEFVLSRHYRQTSLNAQGDILIAGTYATGNNTVYVTLKLLNVETAKVIASDAYTLPIGSNTEALLQSDRWW